jgi:hypothetical protein
MKEEWRESRRGLQPVTAVARDGGSSRTMMEVPFAEPRDWPRFLPPFLEGALLFEGNTYLWVRRAVGIGEVSFYDVMDRRGRLACRVQVPARARVVGFGEDAVYIARQDADDLERLERYRIADRRSACQL